MSTVEGRGFDAEIAEILRMQDASSAADRLQKLLTNAVCVERLCSGAWGDDQALLPRLMRSSSLAEVLMRHPEDPLRAEASNWLSEIDDETARLALIEAASRDCEAVVRASAAEAIADHPPISTLAATALRLLADEDGLVRTLAVPAAMHQGLPSAVRALLLSESDGRVLVRVHAAFAARGDEASTSALYDMFADGDYMIRYTAMNALAQLDHVRDIPRFHEALVYRAADDSARAVSVRAREICAELGLVVGGT